ncbi:MAG: esterase family protein [Clostridiales bacterium]|nr:esterase family protein [Clostridiales bacterium]
MAHLDVNFYSEALGMATGMQVLLPEELPRARARTLYLLHGMSDDESTWTRRTSIERYAAGRGLAVVMPFGGLGWYTDMHRGPKWFSFLTEELPAKCRALFPMLSDRREDTFAAGLSMGGYGALKCGLRAGKVFSRVASLSGALDAYDCALNGRGLAPQAFWEDVFGPAEGIPGSRNDLFRAAEEMRDSEFRPDVYMWCGTEDFLYYQNIRMRDHLRRLGYSPTYGESAGDHQWLYWDRWIQDVLDWLVPGEEGNPWR